MSRCVSAKYLRIMWRRIDSISQVRKRYCGICISAEERTNSIVNHQRSVCMRCMQCVRTIDSRTHAAVIDWLSGWWQCFLLYWANTCIPLSLFFHLNFFSYVMFFFLSIFIPVLFVFAHNCFLSCDVTHTRCACVSVMRPDGLMSC